MLQRIAIVLLISAITAAGQAPKSAGKAPAKPAAAPAPTGPVTAIIHTSMGDMKCELFPSKAPKTVDNFVGLATGTKDWTDPKTKKMVHRKPLYDGVIFHRVIPNFMIQTGDPMGTGYGDPGYKFEDEFSSDLVFDKPGKLAMANSGPNTNGSQFFVTVAPTTWLNNKHSIFGQCDDASVALANKIAGVPVGAANRPNEPITIKHIEIQGMGKTTTAKPNPASKTGATKKSAPKS